jgi:hypothetical protein
MVEEGEEDMEVVDMGVDMEETMVSVWKPWPSVWPKDCPNTRR